MKRLLELCVRLSIERRKAYVFIGAIVPQNTCPRISLILRWEFIKENKKVRKQEKKEKKRTRPRKRSRKKENKISTKKVIKNNIVFSSLSFSCFLDRFLG